MYTGHWLHGSRSQPTSTRRLRCSRTTDGSDDNQHHRNAQKEAVRLHRDTRFMPMHTDDTTATTDKTSFILFCQFRQFCPHTSTCSEGSPLQTKPREKGTTINYAKLCIVTTTVAAGAPVFGVLWGEPVTPEDSGFLCWSKDDAVNPTTSDEPDPDLLVTACLSCVLDAHAEVGALLDRARQNGLATADA
jgi:hypothetical protein